MVPHPPPERRLLGVALRCGSAIAFALMAWMLKLASEQGASVVELVFYRSIGALPVVALWVLPRGGLPSIATHKPLAHLTRTCVGLTSMMLTFGALSLLPLAQATTLSYSAAISGTILSALVLKESVGRHRWAAVLVGFVGVLLVADPFAVNPPLFGLLMGLGASLGQAGVMITVRQISQSETTSAIVFWFTLLSGIATSLLLPWYGHAQALPVLAMLIGAGMIAGVGQLMMTGSLRFAPVSVVVPFDYLQIILATLIGWLALGHVPVPIMLAGAALITGSGIYTAYRERRNGRPVNEALAAPEA